MDRLDVERIGGFAGFGGPGARIRSKAALEWSALSAADRRAIEHLFARGGSASPPSPDAFRCRLTRRTAAGTQTIEVAEHEVPRAVRERLRDTLD